MAPSSIPSHLVPFLSSPQTPFDAVVDALEEWISVRRTKGDTLFEVSVGLAELEDRTPPHLARAFDRARYVTNIPQPSDLTPPTGPFPLSRSASPETILHHLLSYPTPTLEHSREVILEYVLAREGKLKEKKPGRGGKGTLGRDGFEEISRRLGEIEDGLRGLFSPRGPTADLPSSSRNPYPSPKPDNELDESRQLGLALLLSLRLSLSYFTLQELANQLVVLPVADAERTLVQHIRRRVAGEGRWGVAKELEYVESIALSRRRALKSAFRSAKARTNLPPRPNYPIPLPAPSKSVCIKLLNAFAKDFESVPSAPVTPAFSPAGEKSYFARRTPYSPANSAVGGSPKTPHSTLPPSLGSPSSQSAVLDDPNPLANYALELVSEYLTREKREQMAKAKWAKSGRDQLSKDLGEIEAATCMIKSAAGPQASKLLPIFLLLRRTFALPASPLPAGITEPYLDILPAPPDPDDVPLREPTVQTTTAALYVNPRLDDARALDVIEELVETEKEHVESMGATYDEMVDWVVAQVENVKKRFPDGSYADVFILAKDQVARPQSAEPSPSLSQTPTMSEQSSQHRRSRSHALPTAIAEPLDYPASASVRREQHNRSISMPLRRGTYPEDSDSDSDSYENEARLRPLAVTANSLKQLPPLQMLSPIEMSDLNEKTPSATQSAGGWWDVVSAIQPEQIAPWHQNSSASNRNRTSSNSASHLLLPPGAEPAAVPDFSRPYEDITELSQIDLASAPSTPQAENQVEFFPTRTSGLASPLAEPDNSSPRSVQSRPIERDERPPPVPIKFSRPSFPSGQSSETSSLAMPIGEIPDSHPSTPPGVSTKSKLFGRSLSLASKSMLKSRKEDKENEKNASPAANPARKDKVQNNPGKWNRDMVANIMGPPADRR
ncbi:hypothetical protein BCR39DRAFT_527314 [Naematelia encephala]|uniref:Uncharacterized protein n=1 Tax=Naematelia encephala TaxID=71784 RepID=A0A1Y2B960_9TREE|nr:hypothetical protein BCR39DRAFT_527314 [Naematelia encephala]